MLQCVNLVKDYFAGGQIVHAIRDLSVTFRKSEFVSILGPSGCGKTTLLNIIGGLDQYNSGNLIINGKSTKDYTDKDWDTYRNHRVGFVFQSYNLIMHQSVLTNVEMSLVLSGVSEAERRKRAIDALKEVGLEDQIDKKPTQLSGGQMQRVAIARALVNNPEIVLADEPTGALDSKTSVQIMDLLKEVAKDRLVIMVTHNPELARDYSTRLIELRDGQIISDSNPFNPSEQETDDKVLRKTSMSFGTALRLSFANLMTKKGRTLLTSFAGSIGIIGIGLIMSLSNGVQSYISSVENDTMASYPITIEDNTLSIATMFQAMSDMRQEEANLEEVDDDTIRTRPMIESILDSISSSETNNLKNFKEYLDSPDGEAFRETAKAIEYDYDLQLDIYNLDGVNGLTQVSPNDLLNKLGFSNMSAAGSMFAPSGVTTNNEIWHVLPDSEKLREDSYSLVEGSWPQNYNEVVLEVNDKNEISDYVLYSLGMMDQDSLVSNYRKLISGELDELEPAETINYSIEDFLDLDFRILPASDYFEKIGGVWVNQSDNEDYIKEKLDDAQSLKVVGIIKPNEDSTVTSTTMGGVYYDSSLQQWASGQAEDSEIVKEQMDSPNVNVFTGQNFSEAKPFSQDDLTPEQMAVMASMTQEEILAYITTYNENANATYDSNLKKLGVIDYDSPSSISLYASSFSDKEALADLINDYNDLMDAEDKPENVLSYTDYIGILLSGVQQVINMISYVLIGFVSVSLVVSSIMIGIITYISVLERIKEIGILRAIGASKRDIRNVFNAETFLIGLASGILGIAITVLLDWPASLIVENLTGVPNIAVLPWQGAIALVLINLILTMIAGLIPASIASGKNPVEALRVE